MRVIFREEADSASPIAAKGILDIPDEDSIECYVGQLLAFTIEADYSDLPVDMNSEGILAKSGSREFYDFKVVQMDPRTGPGSRSGHLTILSKVSD